MLVCLASAFRQQLLEVLYECLNQQSEKLEPPSLDGTDESPKKAAKMKAYDDFCDRLDQQDMEPFLEQ